MGESLLRLGKHADSGFVVVVDFGGLAGETGMGPSLGVFCDPMPYELLFEEGSCGTGRRMGEAIDKVKDLTAERQRDRSPVVVDGDVLPLKGGEERPTGVCLWVL